MTTHIKALLALLASLAALTLFGWLVTTYPFVLGIICVSVLLVLVYIAFYKLFEK